MPAWLYVTCPKGCDTDSFLLPASCVTTELCDEFWEESVGEEIEAVPPPFEQGVLFDAQATLTNTWEDGTVGLALTQGQREALEEHAVSDGDLLCPMCGAICPIETADEPETSAASVR